MSETALRQPTYGSPGRTGEEVGRTVASILLLADEEAERLIAQAGHHERPPVSTFADLTRARPAVFYYALRLFDEAAARETQP